MTCSSKTLVLARFNGDFQSQVSSNISSHRTFGDHEIINGLDISKSNVGLIPVQVLKIAAQECCIPLTDCINTCNGVFPDELKLADVITVRRGAELTCKENYCFISSL